ncbi:MAG: hypothetical protein ACRD0W_09855 [Acidimicrobiales bacterium]
MVNTIIEPRTFDEDQVSEALSAVVNENPKATNVRNVYFNFRVDGRPCCMIGHVLARLGVTDRDVVTANCNTARIDRALKRLRITIPPRSLVMLRAAQYESDWNKRAWYFAAARGRLAALGQDQDVTE